MLAMVNSENEYKFTEDEDNFVKVMEKGNEYTYEFIYQVDSLSCILIHIKNKEDVEGIVLDNYSLKQRSYIYNELMKRINND